MRHVTIYTDGAARGNPGPGGYAAVLEYIDSRGISHTKEVFAGCGMTTNNRMELVAAIAGIRCLIMPCEVILYSDSKYLVDAFNQGWIKKWQNNEWKKSDGTPVKNIDLWKLLIEVKQPHNITFRWVKGHAGNRQNERCDQLATAAADSIADK